MSETEEEIDELLDLAYSLTASSFLQKHDELAKAVYAALLSERERALEEAAKVADLWEAPEEERQQYSHGNHYIAGLDDAGERIAAAIRGLK